MSVVRKATAPLPRALSLNDHNLSPFDLRPSTEPPAPRNALFLAKAKLAMRARGPFCARLTYPLGKVGVCLARFACAEATAPVQ